GCPLVAKAVIEAACSHTLVTGLASLLVGEDPLETRRLWNRVYRATLYCGCSGAVIQAMVGIDIALRDINGRAVGEPIVTLPGGALRRKMRVHSSNMFQFRLEDALERTKGVIDKGHSAVKFGWEPFGRDDAKDLRTVDGFAHLPDAPGLGVEPNMEVTEKYLVR
ncbi:MAG: hypothetical protein ACREFS_16575, partial [Acetobacteraceae bacterium]